MSLHDDELILLSDFLPTSFSNDVTPFAICTTCRVNHGQSGCTMQCGQCGECYNQGGCGQGCGEGCGQSQPSGPTSYGSISITSRSNTSITLRLSSIPDATSYVVAYRRSDVSGTAITKSTSSTSVTISGLDPDTEYTFNYYGQNSYGTGPYMPNGVTARTTYTAASFSISDIGTTDVTLRVNVGSSTEFIIYCTTPAGREIWNETVYKTSNFNYTIPGLIPNTSYKVNIHYDVGNSWCGTKEFTTESARPDNWSWWSTIAQDKPIHLSANEWNTFCVRVNEFREYKGLPTYGSFITAYPGNDISATIVNHAVWAIGAMNSSSYSLEVSPGDTISANFFIRLSTYLNSL